MISQLTVFVKGHKDKAQKKVLKNIWKYLTENKVGYFSESAPSTNGKDCTYQIRFDSTIENYLLVQIKSLSKKKDVSDQFDCRTIVTLKSINVSDEEYIEITTQNKEEEE